VIDGAHAPGQIPLDLEALGADVYAGNCHKWLCAPKGSGFLHVRSEQQAWVESLIVSWGWIEGNEHFHSEHPFVSRNQWQGTRDVAAFLATPAAIDFQADHDWPAVRAACHSLAAEARVRLAELTGLPPITPDSGGECWPWFAQMVAVPLPPVDGRALQRRLYEEHRIEVPILAWNGRSLLRASFQGYNTRDDLEALLAAVARLLPEMIERGPHPPTPSPGAPWATRERGDGARPRRGEGRTGRQS
jgi:isopenicillin-N epimerase